MAYRVPGPSWLPDLVTGVSRSTGAAVSRAARAAGLNGRGVWSRPGRHHIEVRGVSQAGGERLARQVERALAALPGVAWARVNGPSGRVVVAVTPRGPRLRDLMATIATVERRDGLVPDPDCEPPHPPEEGPRTKRAVSAIAADALGLTLAAASRVLPFTRVPGEAANLINVVDLHPRLHEIAGKGLRPDRANSLFPLVEALVQGLAGGWAGTALDAGQRLLQWSEARAQLAAWNEAEPDLAGTPDRAAAPPCPDDRPLRKPDGPVERYAGRILAAGGVAAAALTPLVGGKRAAAVGLAAMPKAGATGREGYAARLGRTLAHRGVIAMERGVLRELDRIDTLLLDESVLRGDRSGLTELVPLPGTDAEQVATRAFGLFRPADPAEVATDDGWRLGPLDRLSLRGRTGEREARRLGHDGGTVLGLAEGERLAAVLRTEPEPAPGAEALMMAARRAGLRVLVAGEADERYAMPASRVPGGERLLASVRRLQRDGATVMLVSGDGRALGAADCGLGVWRRGDRPPWGAHLLIGPDLEVASLVVDAAGLARQVARQSIRLSAAGTGVGALAALTATPRRLPQLSVDAVNAAAGISLLNGMWRAHKLPDRPRETARPVVPWHLMPVPVVLDHLRARPEGLTTDDVRGRARRDVDRNGPLGLRQAFVEELANPLTPVLAGGAALSAAVGSPVDAGLVGGVIGVSALVGATQRVRTERALAELLSRSAVTATVRRDGTERVVSADDLVPGDIVLLGPGDAVPADCRLIEADAVEADESSLTGESLPVPKAPPPVVAAAVADRSSMLYEGTTVAAGRATGVVVAVGADTEVGRSMALAREAPPSSGVEQRLTGLTRTAVPLAVASAVSVAGAGLLRGVPLGESAATAANLAVASVPEGLPFLVGAAQLAAARRLAEHGALVRNPRTIEALGRVDVLCFDKTGTLTEGRLRLVGVGDGRRYASLADLDAGLRGVLAAAIRATPQVDSLDELSGQTDRAVVEGARGARVEVATGCPGWRAAESLPFEPSRGYHATAGNGPDGFRLDVKGAPERILPRCRRALRDGRAEPLDDDGHRRLAEALDELAGGGHRVLAVAQRSLPAGDVTDAAVDELTFLGFLAIADGVRASAAPAVRRIRHAGVHTIMITGDHPATAAAIASIIGADDERQRVVTATELDTLDDDAVAETMMRTDVVARCTPAHKVRIIQALQRCGRTVAMTGDGANDAPAIRLADVGIALGQRGTPAARAAADLVVTDDKLETIIATLVEGRAMWSSVRHALSILVGGNLGEIAFSVLSAAVTGRSALNGRQLLLVNLLTDLAPAMAIAVRPPHASGGDELLAEGPDTSLGATLQREMALRAAATTLGATTGWTIARFTGTQRRASTVALASLIGSQLGQTVLAGGASPPVLLATGASVATLAAIVQTPGLSHFFGCTPLGPVGWSIAAGSAVSATLANSTLGRRVARLTLHESDGSAPAEDADAGSVADAYHGGRTPDDGGLADDARSPDSAARTPDNPRSPDGPESTDGPGPSRNRAKITQDP
ncbi:HAD-IC family P-type ATPase [Plantactinospora sp. GCM10030261]|uniref:cation-translocating P-type ATPase n=1 Tax=Plantactinospora sp. GCM10030261 TaxID=3273420 RepID=UPI0036163CB4